MILLAILGLANALRVLWLTPSRPTDDAVWDACLLREACTQQRT